MTKSAKGIEVKGLSVAQRKSVATLAAQPDGAIDYADIPPLTESFWKNPVRNPFYGPIKQQLTARQGLLDQAKRAPPRNDAEES